MFRPIQEALGQALPRDQDDTAISYDGRHAVFHPCWRGARLQERSTTHSPAERLAHCDIDAVSQTRTRARPVAVVAIFVLARPSSRPHAAVRYAVVSASHDALLQQCRLTAPATR